ncbi:MAG: hypothetical protein JWM77_2828, partial [Rhodospirillales bacterium]|nr:hypothetical protein [Rhodospirillales bacterium]
MGDPGYEALRGLWEKKRGGRRFPAWSDFASGELARFWPHTMVLEVLDGRDFRYRHYGAGLAILFGNDFTDRTTSSLPVNERHR